MNMTDMAPNSGELPTNEAETLRIADEAAKRLLRHDMPPHSWGASADQKIDHAYSEGDDATVRAVLEHERRQRASQERTELN